MKKGNKKMGQNKIPTVGNSVGALEIWTGNCSKSITLWAPLQLLCRARVTEPKMTKLHWVSVCPAAVCDTSVWDKTICAKNSNISRLWLVEIGDRGVHAGGSMPQSQRPATLHMHKLLFVPWELSTDTDRTRLMFWCPYTNISVVRSRLHIKRFQNPKEHFSVFNHQDIFYTTLTPCLHLNQVKKY